MTRWILYALLLIPGSLCAGKPQNPFQSKKHKYTFRCKCRNLYFGTTRHGLKDSMKRKHRNCKFNEGYFNEQVINPSYFFVLCNELGCTYKTTGSLGERYERLRTHNKKKHSLTGSQNILKKYILDFLRSELSPDEDPSSEKKETPPLQNWEEKEIEEIDWENVLQEISATQTW